MYLVFFSNVQLTGSTCSHDPLTTGSNVHELQSSFIPWMPKLYWKAVIMKFNVPWRWPDKDSYRSFHNTLWSEKSNSFKRDCQALKIFLTLYKCFKWTMITVVKYFSCSITWKFQNANIHKAMQYFLLVASQTVALRHLTTLVNSCYFFKIPLKQALL